MYNNEKESINKTSVDNIIALCNILNDYDEFYKNLKIYFQNKKISFRKFIHYYSFQWKKMYIFKRFKNFLSKK